MSFSLSLYSQYCSISNADPNASKDLDKGIAPIYIDPSQFHGSLNKGKDENDSNCWTSPSGTGFMIRGKTYLKDSSKVGFSFLSKFY